MALSNERVAWFNGKILPESQVVVPFRDSSWTYGDGVFDMTRTFNGKAFRLKEHIQRLFHSLKYTGIDPGLSQQEMVAISEDVLERNRHLLGKGDDFWLGQRVSRGVKKVEGDQWDHYGPNVIVECMPLPLKERATLFRDGIDVIVPSVRRVPPDSLTPRAKTHNYLNLIMADREVRVRDPKAWAVLLDVNGNLCEGLGSNIFVVRDGKLRTPRERYVLPGISRQATIDLAAELEIPFACLYRRRDLPDLDQPVHLRRAQPERQQAGRRERARPDHRPVDEGVSGLCRLRLRPAISRPAGELATRCVRDLRHTRKLRAHRRIRLCPRDLEHGGGRALPFRRPWLRRRAVAGALRSGARRPRSRAVDGRTLGVRGVVGHDRLDPACRVAAARRARPCRPGRRFHRRQGNDAEGIGGRGGGSGARQCGRQ